MEVIELIIIYRVPAMNFSLNIFQDKNSIRYINLIDWQFRVNLIKIQKKLNDFRRRIFYKKKKNHFAFVGRK